MNHYSSAYLIANICLFTVFSILSMQTQETIVSAQPTERFLLKYYNMEQFEDLPKELQCAIARHKLPDVFSPLLAAPIKTFSLDHTVGYPATVNFSPDSSHVAISSNLYFYIYSCTKDESFFTQDFNIDSFQFNTSGTQIAYCDSKDGKLKLLKFVDGTIISAEDDTDVQFPILGFSEIAITPQNKFIISCVDTKNCNIIGIYDPETKKTDHVTFEDTIVSEFQSGCKLSENKPYGIFIKKNHALELFSLETLERTNIVYKEEDFEDYTFCTVGRICAFRNSKIALSQLNNGSIAILDMATKQKCCELYAATEEHFIPLVFNHDARFLFVYSKNQIHIYHSATGICFVMIPNIVLRANWSCKLSPDGRHFALAANNKLTMIEWNPSWTLFDDFLMGRISLEQLLLIQFLKDMKDGGFIIGSLPLNEAEKYQIRQEKLSVLYLEQNYINEIKEIFHKFTPTVRRYLTDKYFLHF